MATVVNVSTWTELTSAITANYESELNITINILNDIDCNNEIPEGVPSTISLPTGTNQSTYRYFTINGNGHTIRNLRSHVTSPVSIFYLPSSYDYIIYTFNDISFINLVLTSNASFVKADSFNRPTQRGMRFNRCNFVGRREYSLFTVDRISANTIFNNCFFNIPNMINNLDIYHNPLWYKEFDSNVYANFCWFRFTYLGKPNVGYQNYSYLYDINLNGCYIDGEFCIDNSSYSIGSINITSNYTYNATIQNVCDLKIMTTSAPSGTTTINMTKGIIKDRLTVRGNDSVTYPTTYNAAAIPIPPDKMLDAQYLYDHGFDVIVPTSS